MKICQSCGTKYAQRKEECPNCKSTRTAPSFVRELRPITRFTSVALQEAFEKSDETVIAINCWFPRAQKARRYLSNRIIIQSPERWEAIKSRIDGDLGVLAGWLSREEALRQLESAETIDESLAEYRAVLEQYPRETLEFLSSLNLDELAKVDIDLIPRAIELLGKQLMRAEEAHRNSFFSLLEKIDISDKEGMDKLQSLMDDWRLIEIARISDLILYRLATIERLEHLIHDEKVYELRGGESIHRFLERNLWVVNENYLLLRSNRSLREFIGDEILKRHKKQSRRRPDFVCSEHGKRLIIIEIKAPSHVLTKDDLDQIEDYREIIHEYRDTQYTSIEGYLVGKKVPTEVRRRAQGRNYIKAVMAYDELVRDARERYRQYYDELEQLRAEA